MSSFVDDTIVDEPSDIIVGDVMVVDLSRLSVVCGGGTTSCAIGELGSKRGTHSLWWALRFRLAC